MVRKKVENEEIGDFDEEEIKGNFLPIWKPKQKGVEEIYCKIKEIRETENFGKRYDVVLLKSTTVTLNDGEEYELEKGEEITLPAHTNLQNKLNGSVQTGDMLHIVSEGKVKFSNGRYGYSYKVYRLKPKTT